MRVVENVNVGTPDVESTTPSHVPGVHEGNQPAPVKKRTHLQRRPERAFATAARSTGINPAQRNPIDPRMPNLSPA